MAHCSDKCWRCAVEGFFWCLVACAIALVGATAMLLDSIQDYQREAIAAGVATFVPDEGDEFRFEFIWKGR